MSTLIVCPSCHRHLRTSEVACPFCTTDVRSAVARALPRPMPRERLGRTAMLAFATANLGVAACGGDVAVPAPVDGSTNSGGAAETGGTNSAGTGGGNVFTGGAPNTGGTLSTGGIFCCPPYGLPPPPYTGGSPNIGGTAGAGATPGAGGTSGNSGMMMPVPIYGAPPSPDKPQGKG